MEIEKLKNIAYKLAEAVEPQLATIDDQAQKSFIEPYLQTVIEAAEEYSDAKQGIIRLADFQDGSYYLSRAMLFKKDRDLMDRAYLVESIHTGRHWRISDKQKLKEFFTGRNKESYRIFKQS